MFANSSLNGNMVADFDNLPNNLIIEFLNKEMKSINDETGNESNTESIFEEINRLSNRDDRSVDEILREAESLLEEQNKFSKFNTKIDKCSNNVDEFYSDSAISEESTPKDLVSCSTNYNSQISDAIDKIGDIERGIQTNIDNDNDFKDGNIKNFQNNICSTLINNFKTKTLEESQNIKLRIEKNDTHPLLIQSENLCSKMPLKICCDKSKTILSKHHTPKKISPIMDTPTITKESVLKNEIDILQEKLKDTEERLQSLRIQHNSLSQIHRDLKENQSHLQEESELLKLDVQHLTECVNVLRNELQMARNDRKEAIELQQILQDELEESKVEKKKLREQCEKDAKTIQDLQRQCKEMERILMRKHPDSVSALIVASKNAVQASDETSISRKLLEQRIAQLELDAKEQDLKAQKILANVQTRFNSVQAKYETHIADLETQVLSLQEINTKLNEKINSQLIEQNQSVNLVTNYCQTDDIPEREIQTKVSSTQTDSKLNTDSNRQKPIKKGNITNRMNLSSSDHTHIHQAAIKEETHLLATIRGMRVDLAIKDKAIQRLTKELDECKKTIKKLQKEKEAMKIDKSTTSFNSYKTCDDQNSDKQALEKALRKIKVLEMDNKALHDKRLQDLKALQVAHEREMSSFNETFQILQQRLTESDENFAIQKCRKIPVDYYALKAKVSSLEKRHSEREQRLHMLVEALSKGRLNNAVGEIFNENN